MLSFQMCRRNQPGTIFTRGVWLAKKWLRFSFRLDFAEKLQFLVRLHFYKLAAVSVFSVRFLHCCVALYWVRLSRFRITFVYWRHLSFMPLRYDARSDVLPCWICPTNCRSKWLRTRSAEIRYEDKYFDCWSYYVGRWIVNETTWKTTPKPPKSIFLKTELWKLSFRFLNFEVSSVWFLENRYPTFSSGSTRLQLHVEYLANRIT